MGWYVLISLMSDSRIRFLLWFIVVAIIVAIILIFTEINLKRKRERVVAKLAIDSPIEKINHFLKNNKSPREKLDFVDKTAKRYFKDTYGNNINSNYSELIRYFGKHRRQNEANFCKSMFEAYYSDEELTNSKVIALGKMLINVETAKWHAEEISMLPTFMDRIERFFKNKKMSIIKKRETRRDVRRISKKHGLSQKIKVGKMHSSKQLNNNIIKSSIENKTDIIKQPTKKVKSKKQKQASKILPSSAYKASSLINIIERIKMYFSHWKINSVGAGKEHKFTKKDIQGVKAWIKEAIGRGYNRNGILSLLNDNRRSPDDIKQILKIYDDVMNNQKSSSLNAKKDITIGNVIKSEGIAEQIIKKAKHRLESEASSLDSRI